MVSHVNDMLRVPIMLPLSCRVLAARCLVIAVVQIALGRLADSWIDEENAALYRPEILATLSRGLATRVRTSDTSKVGRSFSCVSRSLLLWRNCLHGPM